MSVFGEWSKGCLVGRARIGDQEMPLVGPHMNEERFWVFSQEGKRLATIRRSALEEIGLNVEALDRGEQLHCSTSEAARIHAHRELNK
jgi:hypothetical protein